MKNNYTFTQVLTQLSDEDQSRGNHYTKKHAMTTELAKNILAKLINDKKVYLNLDSLTSLNIDNRDITLEIDVIAVIRPRNDYSLRKTSIAYDPSLLSQDDLLLSQYAINTYSHLKVGEGTFAKVLPSQTQYHFEFNPANGQLILTSAIKQNKGLRVVEEKDPNLTPPSSEEKKVIQEMYGDSTYWITDYTDDLVNIVPLIHGSDLADYIDTDEQQEILMHQPEQQKKWMLECFLMLNYLHINNLVHLDIKYENLMIWNSTKRLALVDFDFISQMNSSLSRVRGSLPFVPYQVRIKELPANSAYQDIFAALIVVLSLINNDFLEQFVKVNEYMGDSTKILQKCKNSTEKNTILWSQIYEMKSFQEETLVNFVNSMTEQWFKGPANEILNNKKISSFDVLTIMRNTEEDLYQQLFREILTEDLAQQKTKFPNTPLSSKLVYQCALFLTANQEQSCMIWNKYKKCSKSNNTEAVKKISSAISNAFHSQQPFDFIDFEKTYLSKSNSEFNRPRGGFFGNSKDPQGEALSSAYDNSVNYQQNSLSA